MPQNEYAPLRIKIEEGVIEGLNDAKTGLHRKFPEKAP